MINQDKYKVGDRVRIIFNRAACFGMIGTVVDYGSSDFTKVLLDNGTNTYWSYEDSLELYAPTINFDRNIHKDTMLAWVNGSEIERYDDSCNTWWLDAGPKFETDVEYRVKRKVKVFKYKFAKYQGCSYPIVVAHENYSQTEEYPTFIHWIGDEYTVEYPED